MTAYRGYAEAEQAKNAQAMALIEKVIQEALDFQNETAKFFAFGQVEFAREMGLISKEQHEGFSSRVWGNNELNAWGDFND